MKNKINSEMQNFLYLVKFHPFLMGKQQGVGGREVERVCERRGK